MPRIRSVATALPPHRLNQPDAMEACRRALGDDRLLAVFKRSGVDTRYFAFPPEYYLNGHTFAERNRDYIEQAVALGERAIRDALEKADAGPRDIDHFFFVTTTGLATPSVDARLAHRLGMRADVSRNPLFGIGCAGGAAAIARASRMRGRSLVLSVELCGQTFRNRDRSPENYVGAALFGDGAAAVVIDGSSQGPEIVACASELFPGTQGVMGWDFVDDGLKLVLTKEVPKVMERDVAPAVDRFLASRGLSRGRVDHFILHPGGRRVLETYRTALGLRPWQLRPARECLRTVGNLSSAAVLFVLASIEAKRGDVGLMAAVGPGFAVEMVLLRW
jgi:alkylresorcinol/alkylpyrone synthase